MPTGLVAQHGNKRDQRKLQLLEWEGFFDLGLDLNIGRAWPFEYPGG